MIHVCVHMFPIICATSLPKKFFLQKIGEKIVKGEKIQSAKCKMLLAT